MKKATMQKLVSVEKVYTSFESPVGPLWLVASDQGLHGLYFRKEFQGLKESTNHPILKKTIKQLGEYFSGKRKSFDLPLVIEGTEFQFEAWKKLVTIPYGETVSYQEQAKRIGDVKKARAVGMANSKNPIAIIVPCHRVIAKSGKLQGFGGGLKTKKFLIDLEKASV